MEIQDGRPVLDTEEKILNELIRDAKQSRYFGPDLNDTEEAVIRAFYQPVAARFAEAQEDIGLVLDSSQIDHAEGKSLDLLTALIGVPRRRARRATGEVTFSRSDPAGTDYVIPKGTVVQTDSIDPVRFETTKAVTLVEGETEVTVPVEAQEGGVEGNVGPNSLIIMPNPPSGVEAVTNTAETTGGANEEPDDELRDRAKSELAEGSRASLPALFNALKRVDGVTSVDIIENDSSLEDEDGRGSHSIEPIVAGNVDIDEIAQTIYDTKAGGIPIIGGFAGELVTGTAELPNGETKTVEFSIPIEVQIYVDLEMRVTDEYAGDDTVRDNIVKYIGGILTSGNEYADGLKVSEDVLYGEIEYAIRTTNGVYDIDHLYIGTSTNPTGTSNIEIETGKLATADATDGSISITTTTV